MGLLPPFLTGTSRKKRTQFISMDLGSRTTKAVLMERRGDAFALLRYALMDAPIYEKRISPEMLADHFHTVVEALGSPTKYFSVAVGLGDAVIRQVELPQIPVDQMRSILKVNHKNYLSRICRTTSLTATSFRREPRPRPPPRPARRPNSRCSSPARRNR